MSVNQAEIESRLATLVADFNGRPLEVEDPSNRDQCMDLAFGWLDRLGIDRAAIRHLLAYEVFTNPNDLTRQAFDLIPNEPDNYPLPGDLVVWRRNGAFTGIAGHIDVALPGSNQTTFRAFDQNWSGHEFCEINTHGYSDVLGWLHPKTNQGGDTPMADANVTVKQSQIDDWLHGPDGIDHWKNESYVRGLKITELTEQLADAKSNLKDLGEKFVKDGVAIADLEHQLAVAESAKQSLADELAAATQQLAVLQAASPQTTPPPVVDPLSKPPVQSGEDPSSVPVISSNDNGKVNKEPSMSDFNWASYRKAIVAVAGVAVSVLTIALGQHDPRVIAIIQALTAIGVYGVRNEVQ